MIQELRRVDRAVAELLHFDRRRNGSEECRGLQGAAGGEREAGGGEERVAAAEGVDCAIRQGGNVFAAKALVRRAFVAIERDQSLLAERDDRLPSAGGAQQVPHNGAEAA